ncbi:hypothetical protein PAXRUDRAFT_16254 [Paxillus rubicundulus Ve08.2h10]|uniref:HAT C-terminal dimerisation domain-containing protein n=1 Tax=Paxillus rubicundulus Ve08.2h10 TaxID=930991 RepID=A0A0D0DF29_9AGAM|nr:hypothetical protein PAXRUDRAFT_16254 [Paxillus rubicundulus Ve08.2h10]
MISQLWMLFTRLGADMQKLQVLDPSQKDVYFKKYWGKELHAQVLKNVEQLEKYTQMYGNGGPFVPEKKKGKLPQLLRELSSDEDGIAEDEYHDMDPQSPWLKEFNLYLHSATSIADSLSIVQWWGLNAQQYHVWASLAQNYLSIMASSVSSEHALYAAAQELMYEEECYDILDTPYLFLDHLTCCTIT